MLTPEEIDAIVERALFDATKKYIGKTLGDVVEGLCDDLGEVLEIPASSNYRVVVDVDPDTLCPTITVYPAFVDVCVSATAGPEATS